MLAVPLTLKRSDARLRRAAPQEVLFAGVVYAADTKSVTADAAGISFLGRLSLGSYAPAADPRMFLLSAASFAPYTSVPAPSRGARLLWHGSTYQVIQSTTEDVAGQPADILNYACRVLMSEQGSGIVPVFDTEQVQLWRPATLRSATDATSLNVKDVPDTAQGSITAFFVPLAMQEKLSLLGAIDTRVDSVYTNSFLQLGDVLYRPTAREAWVVIAPSEVQPGPGLIRAQAKHQTSIPPQVKAANP